MVLTCNSVQWFMRYKAYSLEAGMKEVRRKMQDVIRVGHCITRFRQLCLLDEMIPIVARSMPDEFRLARNPHRSCVGGASVLVQFEDKTKHLNTCK